MEKLLRAVFLTASISVSLSGCVIRAPFHQDAVHYNNVAAQANNELMLRNIIRAKDREPIYYSALSELRGSLSYGGSIGSSATIDGNTTTTTNSLDPENFLSTMIARGAQVINPTGSLNYSSSPSFDYELLDTQEFYNAITASIPADTLANYLRQGWHAELIAALATEDVTFIGELLHSDDKPVETKNEIAIEHDLFKINNDAKYRETDSGNILQNFGLFLQCFSLEPVSRRPDENVKIAVDDTLKKNLSLEGLSELGESGWRFKDSEITHTNPRADAIGFKLVNGNENDEPDCSEYKETAKLEIIELLKQKKFQNDKGVWEIDTAQLTKDEKNDGIRESLSSSPPFDPEKGTANVYTFPIVKKSSDGRIIHRHKIRVSVSMGIRSTQGLIYFLGEYIRAIDETAENNLQYKVYAIHRKDVGYRCVFQLTPGAPRSALVRTRVRSKGYHIPHYQKNTADDKKNSRKDYRPCKTKYGSEGNRNVYNSLAFINQMINLRKSADTRPNTVNVRSVL